MIKVTRLNGKEFVVNADLIQYLEETPDTIITLVNHEKVVVKDSYLLISANADALKEQDYRLLAKGMAGEL